MMVSATI